MSDLIKNTGDNVGGFHSIQIIDITNINTLPDHTDYVITEDIDLKEAWSDLAFTSKTLKLSPGEINSDKGIAYKPTITFFHPKDNAASLKVLQGYLNINVIAKIKNNNGDVKIVGSLETPLRIKYKLSTGNKYDSRPGYNVTIFGTSLLPTLFFTGNTTITP